VVVTADHVGSTSVPGLVAKDVIDLQLGVRSLGDVDNPSALEALQDKGFPRADGSHHDNSKDGTHWPKVFFGSSDPGRCVHLHVREVGSPGWRWALLFRDWMRAVPQAREEYAAEKVALAGAGLSTTEYAAAKEPWFDAASERAEAWAADTGWEPEGG
jgi:dephospho-CoA kinase